MLLSKHILRCIKLCGIFVLTGLLPLLSVSGVYALDIPHVISTDSTDAHKPAPVGKTIAVLPEKRLRLYSLHTRETADVVFWQDGAYLPEALDALNHFLRDHRTQQVTKMDPELFMLVHRIYEEVGGKQPIQIISGYRSKISNNMLRSIGRKVAKKSQHIEGKAMDIRIPGVELKLVRDTALKMGVGGVGYYPQNDFVHVDTGRPRFW